METLTEEQKEQKASKRYFRVMKDLWPPVKYMDEIKPVISDEEWLHQYRKFLSRGEVDRKTYYHELYAHCTAEVCMREVILCSGSTNEIFHQFVRLSTFTQEPTPFEIAMGKFKNNVGWRFFEFLQSFVLLVIQEKQPSGKFRDIFDDPRFFPLIEKYLRMSPYKLSPEECQSKRLIISTAIEVEGPHISTAIAVEEPHIASVVASSDQSNRHEGVKRDRREFEEGAVEGAKMPEHKRTLTRKPPSESSKKLFQKYVLGFQTAYQRKDDPDVIYTSVLPGKCEYLYFQLLWEYGVSSKFDVEFLSDAHLFEIASCLKEIPKKRFMSQFFTS
jgi:hypothetical protein